ncbi:hypothetical protein ACLOJK_016623 [Asimina triloba]
MPSSYTPERAHSRSSAHQKSASSSIAIGCPSTASSISIRSSWSSGSEGMPEIQANAEDDAFGDFEFVSFSSVPSRSNPMAAEDDEWGDFVENPIQSQSQAPPNPQPLDLFAGLQMAHVADPQPLTVSQLQPFGRDTKSESAAEKRREKPQGAIPLSIFGEEEAEEESDEVDLSVDAHLSQNGFSAKPVSSPKNRAVPAPSIGVGLNDFIMNLYGRDEEIKTENGTVENCVLVDGSDDFDDSDWEFKNASSESRQESGVSNNDQSCSKIRDVQAKTAPEAVATTPTTPAAGQVTEVAQNGSRIENGLDQNISYVENFWEFKDALSGAGAVDFFSKEKVVTVDFFSDEKGIGVVEHSTPNVFVNGKLDYGEKFDNQGGLFQRPISVSNSIDVLNSSSGYAFGNLISNLYSQADQTATMSSAQQQPTENKLNSPQIGQNGNGGLDEDGWEFRDAFSEGKVENRNPESKTLDAHRSFSAISNLCSQAEQISTVNSTKQQTTENELSSLEIVPNGNVNLNEHGWEFRDGFSEGKVENGNTESKTFDTHGSFSACLNIYSQTNKTSTVNSAQQQLTENELSSPQIVPNGNDDFNEDGWEFRDAFSEGKVENGNPELKTSDGHRNFSAGYLANEFTSPQLVLNVSLVGGNDDTDEDGWEFKEALSKGKDESRNSGYDASGSHQKFSAETKLKDFIGFYSKLKDEARFFVLHHLYDLKNAMEIAVVSGEESKVEALDKEIQVAYKIEMGEKSLCGKVHPEEHLPINTCVQELLRAVQDPSLQMLEIEYQLSKKISLAEKDLSLAVWLLEHAITMLLVLTMASEEEQSTYISSWSKMVLACAKELKHGAMIWKHLVEKNIHVQILSEPQAVSCKAGLQYFLALGEIYRVAQMLRVSVSFYKPWILLKSMDPTNISQLLEDCTTSWAGSGLQESLERLPDSADHECRCMVVIITLKSNARYVGMCFGDALSLHLAVLVSSFLILICSNRHEADKKVEVDICMLPGPHVPNSLHCPLRSVVHFCKTWKESTSSEGDPCPRGSPREQYIELGQPERQIVTARIPYSFPKAQELLPAPYLCKFRPTPPIERDAKSQAEQQNRAAELRDFTSHGCCPHLIPSLLLHTSQFAMAGCFEDGAGLTIKTLLSSQGHAPDDWFSLISRTWSDQNGIWILESGNMLGLEIIFKEELLFLTKLALVAMMEVETFCSLNGVDTEDGLYGITYYGKGRMPASLHISSAYSHFFCLFLSEHWIGCMLYLVYNLDACTGFW